MRFLVETYDAMINQNTFKNLLRPVFDSQANWYKKQTNVLARPAKVGERVATITADGLETENVAKQGDYLVKNQTEAKEQYLMSATKFNTRYEWIRKSNRGFDLYSAKGKGRPGPASGRCPPPEPRSAGCPRAPWAAAP